MARKRSRNNDGARGTGSPAGFSRRDGLAALALCLLVGVSYFPAIRLGFVWDDVVITTLKAVRDWSGIWDLWLAPGSAYRQGAVGEDHYWPLLYTTFWLEHKLWGFAPAGYHAVNVALHFINTALLWRLLLRLQVRGAWWIAAVFAVHPLHVEAVTWVIARKDLLSALFYLAAFTTWLRFAEAPRPGRYVMTLALFAAGMLCKTIVVTFPAALVIWHWWKQDRVTGADLLRLLPFFLVGLILAGVDMAIYQKVNMSFDYTLAERTLIAAHSFWFYVWKLLWPAHLALLYARWDIDVTDALAWGTVAAAVGVFTALWFLRHRIGRGPLACALFFALTLSPVLGFVDYGYMNVSFVADRYQYLAGIGVLTLLIGGAAWGVDKLPGAAKMAMAGVAGAVLLLLGAATWIQSSVYQDDLTLFSHSAAINPESWAAHHYAGNEFFKQRRDREAEHHFRRSLELRPRDEDSRQHRNALQNIGETQRRRGQYEEALESYRAALEIDPRYALAHAAMGGVLFELRRYAEAATALGRSLSLGLDAPLTGSVHVFLGQALQELGRRQAAATHFARAMALDRSHQGVLDRLAASRFHQKRYLEALDLYRALAGVDPDNAQNHSNMGACLYNLGRLDEALRSFQTALTLKPDLAMARAGLEQVRRRLRPGRP